MSDKQESDKWPTGPYDVVVIDPPWPVTGWKRRIDRRDSAVPYRTMPLAAIAALPVPALLAGHSWVFVWATQRFLPSALELLVGWNLAYRFTMSWNKGRGFKPVGSPTFDTEFVVCGTRGQPRFADTTDFGTSMNFRNPNGHSVKPGRFYLLLERVCGRNARRLDVFARRRMDGWDVWGDEADMDEEGRFLFNVG